MAGTTRWCAVGQKIRGIRTSNTFQVKQPCLFGGMGQVAIGRREKDGKLYALKTPLDWSPENLEARTALIEDAGAFQKESLVWITMGKHPYVVQAFWFDWDERYRPFLVMEYVEGGKDGTSLRERLKSNRGSLDLPQVVRWLLEAATALIFAGKRVHQGLHTPFIHRDIKPDNLLVGKHNALKVTDFGMVLGKGGTPCYMAPEQWQGAAVEEKTDVYALGCVLYELIRGETPFWESTWRDLEVEVLPQKLKQAHQKQAAPPLPEVPPKLGNLFQQCLNKSPATRPGFLELRQALQEIYRELTGTYLNLQDDPEPLSGEDQNARGSGFSGLGYYDEAIACFDRAIALDSQDPRFYLNRGNAWSRRGNLDEAERDYSRALQLAPTSGKTRLALGDLLAQRGRYEEAWTILEEGRALEPNEPRFQVSLGKMAAASRNFSRAQQYFQQALGLNPALAEARVGMANVYFCQGRFREAERYYQIALRLQPLSGPVYLNLASLYDHQGRPQDRDRAEQWAALLMPGKVGQDGE